MVIDEAFVNGGFTWPESRAAVRMLLALYFLLGLWRPQNDGPRW